MAPANTPQLKRIISASSQEESGLRVLLAERILAHESVAQYHSLIVLCEVYIERRQIIGKSAKEEIQGRGTFSCGISTTRSASLHIHLKLDAGSRDPRSFK